MSETATPQARERATIPRDLAAILDRMEVNHEPWLDTFDNDDELFGQAVGSASSLEKVAEEMGVFHLKGTAAGGPIFKTCGEAPAGAASWRPSVRRAVTLLNRPVNYHGYRYRVASDSVPLATA